MIIWENLKVQSSAGGVSLNVSAANTLNFNQANLTNVGSISCTTVSGAAELTTATFSNPITIPANSVVESSTIKSPTIYDAGFKNQTTFEDLVATGSIAASTINATSLTSGSGTFHTVKGRLQSQEIGYSLEGQLTQFDITYEVDLREWLGAVQFKGKWNGPISSTVIDVVVEGGNADPNDASQIIWDTTRTVRLVPGMMPDYWENTTLPWKAAFYRVVAYKKNDHTQYVAYPYSYAQIMEWGTKTGQLHCNWSVPATSGTCFMTTDVLNNFNGYRFISPWACMISPNIELYPLIYVAREKHISISIINCLTMNRVTTITDQSSSEISPYDYPVMAVGSGIMQDALFPEY